MHVNFPRSLTRTGHDSIRAENRGTDWLKASRVLLRWYVYSSSKAVHVGYNSLDVARTTCRSYHVVMRPRIVGAYQIVLEAPSVSNIISA